MVGGWEHGFVPGTLYKNVATRNFIHKAAALPFILARYIRIAEVTIEQLSGLRRWESESQEEEDMRRPSRNSLQEASEN